MTPLLMLILEHNPAFIVILETKLRGGYYITISYQIKEEPSDSYARHALHAILWSMQFDSPEMANHIFNLFNFLPKLRCMHVIFSPCIACL